MKRKGLVIWFGAMLSLALLGRWHSSASITGRCQLDGTRVVPVYQVDLMRDNDVLASFCCLRCAQEWPDVPADSYWQVRDEITGEPLPSGAVEPELSLFVDLRAPIEGQPESLTIRSDLPARAAIGFVVYHLGLPVMDFRYLGVEETLDLDWRDPWYSRYRSRNLRRQYDAPMSAFLYVEPYEVRVEAIVRPVDLQHWVDLGLEGRKTLPVAIQYELKQRIAEFLAGHLNLSIDGEEVQPELDRVNFLRRTLRTSTVIDPPEELDTISATLGVIYVAPTEGLPQEASITWDLFSPRIQRVAAAATDLQGSLEVQLPEFVGRGPFETLQWLRVFRWRVNAAVASEHVVHSLDAGNLDVSAIQETADLAGPPAGAVPGVENALLDPLVDPSG